MTPLAPTPLAGRVALVTGASRGIGAATASALAGAGARVVRVARSIAAGEHAGFHDVPCDLSQPGAVAHLAEEVLGEVGVPDIVVNGAGVFEMMPFEHAEVDQLERQLAVNLVAAFAVARAFVPAMRGAGRGQVVNVGSVADHVGFPENAIYAATKYGLRGLHESLVAEYRGSGLRFTLVSPGPTDTAVWDPIDPDNRPGFVPRARMLRAADVADAILFAATRPPHVQIEWLRLGPV